MRVLIVVVLFHRIGHAIPNDDFVEMVHVQLKTPNRRKRFIGRKPNEMRV
jgi:hypothetical protein